MPVIDIEEAATWAKAAFEDILETQPTSHKVAWYSAIQGVDYDDDKRPTWTLHTTYPSINIIIGPMDVVTDIGAGYAADLGPTTHMGSIDVDLITSSDLAPASSGDQNWQMKSWDYLLASDGSKYYVVSAVPSTTMVKGILGLRREETRDTALA